MSSLEDILRTTREDLASRRLTHGPSGRARHVFRDALAGPGLGVIAEHKRRSPSAGEIRAGASVAEIVVAYELGGAVACSVLTEQRNFGGSLADLREARAATVLPLLRKDFVVDRFQLEEAAAAGADAVLLIVAALESGALHELHRAAGDLGLDVLVEVHDLAELRRALELEPEIVGVNNRDLRDFSVDIERTLELRSEIPQGVLVVSESGFTQREQLARLGATGVDAVLVGEALMRAPDPAAALRALI